MASRKADFQRRWARSMATWYVRINVKTVTLMDATHGVVEWEYINEWESTKSNAAGRTRRRSTTTWEKTNGVWRVVFSKPGRSVKTRYR